MLVEDVDFIPDDKEKKKKQPAFTAVSNISWNRSGVERLNGKELRLLTTTLGSLLEGGIPLLRAFQVIRKESLAKIRFSNVLGRVEERIRQGQSFSEALQAEPLSFPVFYTQMVQAGEISGNLDAVLAMLALHLEKEDERKRKLIEASAYPGIVLVLGFVTFAVLLKFVIPTITSVYTDFDSELPALTRAVLFASDWVVPLMLIFGAAMIPAVYYYRKHRDRAAVFFLKLPVVGDLIQKNLLSVFTSLLALELKSGIPVLNAIDSVKQTVSWHFFQTDMKRLRESLSQGVWLADALRPLIWIPESACVLIQAGQESGRLPESLEQVHREASRDFETRVQFTLKIIEPLMILAVGAVVGLIVLSAILPILEINTLVR